MRRSVVILFLLVGVSAYGQFRSGLGGVREEDPRSAKTAMTDNGGGFLSGLFDPTRFSMHQTYTMSFSSSGNTSVGLGVFTNTFSYRAADNLFISADLSAVYSPYSSLGEAHAKISRRIYVPLEPPRDEERDVRSADCGALTSAVIPFPTSF